MKLVVASDEKNKITDFVVSYLKSKGHGITLVGDLIEPNEKWVEIGKEAAKMVAGKIVDQGILLCWSGTGICMAANRIKGARAALCFSPDIARGARKWDNANILCLAYGFTKKGEVKKILDAWFKTEFDEEGLNEAHKLDE